MLDYFSTRRQPAVVAAAAHCQQQGAVTTKASAGIPNVLGHHGLFVVLGSNEETEGGAGPIQ